MSEPESAVTAAIDNGSPWVMIAKLEVAIADRDDYIQALAVLIQQLTEHLDDEGKAILTRFVFRRMGIER